MASDSSKLKALLYREFVVGEGKAQKRLVSTDDMQVFNYLSAIQDDGAWKDALNEIVAFRRDCSPTVQMNQCHSVQYNTVIVALMYSGIPCGPADLRMNDASHIVSLKELIRVSYPGSFVLVLSRMAYAIPYELLTLKAMTQELSQAPSRHEEFDNVKRLVAWATSLRLRSSQKE